MSVKFQMAFGLAEPRDCCTSSTEIGPVASAFFWVRRCLEALKSTPRNLPSGGGPEEPLEDDRITIQKILDDPAFWMMLNH
jgi:hypothetical protein